MNTQLTTVPAPAESSLTYLERYKFMRQNYKRFPSHESAETTIKTWQLYAVALACEEYNAKNAIWTK